MFRGLICPSSGGTVYSLFGIFCGVPLQPCLEPAGIIRTKYANCCIYSASWWWANKCSKHVEAINRNKLKAICASCWSYYTDTSTLMLWKFFYSILLLKFYCWAATDIYLYNMILIRQAYQLMLELITSQNVTDVSYKEVINWKKWLWTLFWREWLYLF
jgi:hypothetical protein